MATIQEQIDQISVLLGQEFDYLNTTKADKTELATAVATWQANLATAVQNLTAALATQATAQATALADGLAAQYQTIMGATENDMDTFGEVRAWIQANLSAIQAISDRVKLTAQALSPSEKAQVQANLDVPSNARVNAVEAAAAQAVTDATAAAANATAAVDAKLGHIASKDYRTVVKANYPSRYPA
jgi:hypothetical protein